MKFKLILIVCLLVVTHKFAFAQCSFGVTISGPSSTCSGTLTSISATANGSVGSNVVYEWYLGTSFQTQTTSNSWSTTITAGNVYKVIVKSSSCSVGVSSSNTYAPVVNASTVASVDLAQPDNVCLPGTLTLTASPTNGGNNPTYEFNIDGVIAYTGPSNTYSTSDIGAGSHSSFVRMISNRACASPNPSTSDTKYFTVAEKANMNVTVTGPSVICSSNANATFTATVTNPVGTVSYQWYKYGTAQLNQTSSQFTTNVSQGTTINCSVTSDYWCVNTPAWPSTPYQVNVTTSSNPVVELKVDKSSWCDGEPIEFKLNSQNIGNNTTFEWRLNSAPTPFATTSTAILPAATSSSVPNAFNPGDVVSVDLTNLSGTCLSLTTTSVSTNSIAPISVAAKTDPIIHINADKAEYCLGENIVFTASGDNVNQSSTYLWKLNGTEISQSKNPSLLAGVIPGMNMTTFKPGDVLSVEVLGLNGFCLSDNKASATFSYSSITVNLPPDVVYNGVTTGQSITVNVNYNNLSGDASNTSLPRTYQWSRNGVALPGANESQLSAWGPTDENLGLLEGGDYTLTITQKGCVTTAAPIHVSINQSPSLSFSGNLTTGLNEPVLIVPVVSDVDGTVLKYKWLNVNKGLTTETTEPQYWFTSTEAGTFPLQLTVYDNCQCEPTNSSVSIPGTATATISVTVLPPVNNENYTKHTALMKAGVAEADIAGLPIGEKAVVTEYFDGLGRQMQTVSTQSSPQLQDVVQPTVYDSYGRKSKTYLPVATENNGWYKNNATLIASSGDYAIDFYRNNNRIASDPVPFSETQFESSELNRPLKQFGPGESWRTNDKAVISKYLVNAHGTGVGQEKIIAWTIDGNGMPVRRAPLTGYVETGGYYSNARLNVKETIDENGNAVREYADHRGRTVLKKAQVVSNPTLSNRDHWAQTYYIYDDMGNLRFVFQPELSRSIHASDTYLPNATELANLAFQYQYDARRRMVDKKIPGASSIYMVYDDRDRLVMTQDGNQRAPRQWIFTKYDRLNRVIVTGLHTADSSLTQAKMQRRVNSYYQTSGVSLSESFVGASGTLHGYSNTAYPSAVDPTNVLTVTYYDNYDFKTLIPANYNYTNENLSQSVGNIMYTQPGSANSQTIGMVTGSKVKVLETGWAYTFLKNVNYYDDKHRLIQSISDNYKGGYDRTTSLYDFSGKLLQSKTMHSKSDLNWKDLVSMRLEGNRLIRTGASNGWTSGAASVETLPANTDGWIETIGANNWGNRVFGFSTQNADVNPDNIKYGLYLTGGPAYRVYENGVVKYSAQNFTAYDIFRIERIGSSVKYSKNGVVFYTSTVPSTSALLVDVSLYSISDFMSGLRSSFSTSVKTILRRFEYDHAGRLLKTYHQLQGQPEILLSKNEYNALGQLIDKKLHSTQSSGSDAKQSIDYRYNIRGWLTNINNATVANDGITNDDVNDLFGMNLSYQDVVPGLTISSDKQFNGNISSIEWSSNQSLGTVKSHGYKFAYDPLSRLSAATHLEKTSTWNASPAFHENNLTYDQNGNIQTLNRTDQAGALMDQLSYNYIAGGLKRNQMSWINDAGNKNQGFKEPATSGIYVEYNHDANGNLLMDYNRTGSELLQNPSFDSGADYWTIAGESSRLTFQNGEVSINDGTGASASLTQSNVVTATRPHLVGIDVTRASGTGQIQLSVGGGVQLVVTTSGSYLVPVYPGGSSGQLTITVNGSFTGSIKSVSLKGGSFNSYNHLNLPYSVSRPMDDMVRYTYDASGKKHAQELVDKNLVLKKRSDYVGEYFYENDTLKSINHEEGRIVMTGPTPEYQYNLKDHLGNVRLTFTTKSDTETGLATYESANQSSEQSKFLRTEHVRKVLSGLMDRTNGAADGVSQRLSGGTNEKFGLAKSVSVMPGDIVNAEVYAKYVDPNSSNWTAALSSLMSQVASKSPFVVFDGVAYNTSTSSFIFGGLNGTNTSSGDGPKAYLNWLIFDRGYNFKDGGYVRLSSAPKESGQDVPHEKLSSTILAKEPGYIYVYLSNEEGTPLEVYFDDFKVEHVKSPVVQMDDYYPFGLTFNSYSRENSTEQKYQYNGKELQDELNLGWLDYGARMYDPAISRWMAVDPLADLSRKWSQYTYGNDNPIRFIDPTGMYSTEEWKKDNGITDDDLITVYQAPSDNNEESSESEDQEEAKPVNPASRSVLGTTDYYKFRRDDFQKRYGKNKKAPTYYMSYGDKYAQRFSSELYPKLSGQGKEWLIKTRYYLQILMENGLVENPAMELDDKAFTDFAFDTHPEAYIQGGLLELGFEDKLEIALTPDVQDLMSPGGIKQMGIIMERQAEYYQANPGVLLQHIQESPHAFIMYYKILERYMPDNVVK